MPTPGQYVVVFTTRRTAVDDSYAETAKRMASLAQAMPGYLGMETVRSDDGAGISVSYWESLEALREWREQAEHVAVQQIGRDQWYERYQITVGRIERVTNWERGEDHLPST